MIATPTALPNTRPRGRRLPAAALAVTCVVLSACGTGLGPGDKAGGPVEPTELVLVNNDGGGGLATAPAIERFVERVSELSGGQLAITVEAGPWATDGREITQVATGRADLGWVGTRMFDLLGIDDFRPLHAPLLVDTYELQAAVMRSDVADTVLRSLEQLDIEPLALLADAMRFPAATRPLLTPDDWRGARVWLLESDAYADAVEALGAVPLHGGDIRQMLQDGDADGHEAMWRYYSPSAGYLRAPVVTPNIVLSPRTMALFANPESLADLSDAQRHWIGQAAGDATEWSADHAADGDDAYMDDACRNGARVALASTDDLAALRRSVEPLYAQLRSDPTTADVLARIEALDERTPPPRPPEVPEHCRYQPRDADRPPAGPTQLDRPGPTGDFPHGTYRYRITIDDLAPSAGQNDILQDATAGIVTWTMGAGEWQVTVRPEAPQAAPTSCRGWYAVTDDVVTFTTTPLPGEEHCLPPTWEVHWSATGRTVTWTRPTIPALTAHFTHHLWQRIG